MILPTNNANPNNTPIIPNINNIYPAILVIVFIDSNSDIK